MQGKRIGEFLSRLVPLTLHDVEEILLEQRITSKRFGDIAISLGMCKPEHVWQAWTGQLAQSRREIDLDTFGIDAQAIALVDRWTAQRLRVIPIRISRDELIIATAESNLAAAMLALTPSLAFKAVFVLADHAQIDCAISKYYPTADQPDVAIEANAA